MVHRLHFARTKSIVVTLIACICITVPSWALEDSSITESTVIGSNFDCPTGGTRGREPIPIHRPGVILETLVFIKNLEISQLSDKGIEGQTLIQSMVPVRGVYRAGARTTLEVGAILGHKFGDQNDVDMVAPLARIVHQPRPRIYLVAGTIFPTHPVHEAIYDDIQKFGANDENMKFRDNVEQGFQLRVDRVHFQEDLWINWKTREEEDTQEEFEVASVSRFRFLDNALFLDWQMRAVHIGGQNNDLDLGVDENQTLLGGISYGVRHPFGIEMIEDLRIGGAYLASSDGTVQPENKTGDGVETEISAVFSFPSSVEMIVNLSHFAGDGFYSRGGDPLYTLDSYSQLGVTALFHQDEDLVIETGVVGQLTDDAFNVTFMVNFLWHHGFFMK